MGMRRVATLILVLGLAGAIGLFAATGAKLFTQVPSESLSKLEQTPATEDPFAGLGMNDVSGEPVKVDNTFRFGLLPSGSEPAAAASVLSVIGPLVALWLVAMWLTRRPAPAAG